MELKKAYLYFVFIAITFFFIGRFSNTLTALQHHQEVENVQKTTQDNNHQKNDDKKWSDDVNQSKSNHVEKSKKIYPPQANVPQNALNVLTYIRQYNEAPEGYVGGRIFQNRERLLPQKDDEDQVIKYREWDIYPKIKNKNRGAERLVTSDNSAYYTSDHYRSFIKIIE